MIRHCAMWKTIDQRWMCMALMIVITLIATWLRLWRSAHVPPGLEYDEAMNGLDAIWMLKTATFYLFVPSNHGREAMFFFPTALFIALLGATPLALRLTSVLVGILTVPLVYRLTIVLFHRDPRRDWLALVAAAGLAVSLWHIGMSRVAFRAILTPFFFMLTAYFFWRGWQTGLSRYFVWMGVVLGLSQYTYLAARLFPIVFLLCFAGGWLLGQEIQVTKLSDLWRNLLIVVGVSGIVFAPSGLSFLNDPTSFSRRAGQISFQVQWSVEGIVALANHLAQAFSLFLGSSDPRIRHHLIERPVFDGLTLVAFWVGVIVAIRQWRRLEYLFLLSSVFILWLPGPLSVDPIHSLRTSGILPAFFILVAVGLLRLVRWGATIFSHLFRRFQSRGTALAVNDATSRVGLVSLGLVILVVGGINTFDYFVRWANHPLTYQEYKGPYIDLAQYATRLTETADVVLPYKFYAYPPVRYVLRNNFHKELTLPFSPFERLTERSVIYLNWFEDIPSSSVVWLTHDEDRQGFAYISRSLQKIDDNSAQLVLNSRGNVIATSKMMDDVILAQIYQEEPIVTTPFILGDHIHLAGYELASPVITTGEPGAITFYWQGLRDVDLAYGVFIQVLDDQGKPITQLEEMVIKDDQHYYENRDGFVSQQHLFWTGPDTPPGLYLLRVGLFNPPTGERLPITTAGEFVGDQIILTPFYVSTNGVDPRLPDTSLRANLGQAIELLGYSPDKPLGLPLSESIRVKLYWQATGLIEDDYTAFVQLLDTQNQVISQWDSQPLGGLYPTSRWQTGQILVSWFTLPLSSELAEGTYRLVMGMYDLTTGVRLPATDAGGQQWSDDMVILTQTTIP